MDALLNAAGGVFNADKDEAFDGQVGEQRMATTKNRFDSTFAVSTGQTKWFVDGCSYFWAVSEALKQAKESILIMDWWLSPEVYLRRPPASNEEYRIDVMLKAAAERGVAIYVIVHKEVEAALTLNSQHTKNVLEGLHPNIRVFRHPDHMPSGTDLKAELGERLEDVTNLDLASFSEDLVTSIYGTAKDVTLFWAHHEKLVVIDSRLAFMGGLDLCFGRWDTNTHPIADAHPGDLDAILFPGQDYNNARVFDFADVQDLDQNKLDRTKSSRMGWSDVALSLRGSIVRDLVAHFIDRWNFIFHDKYSAFDGEKYQSLRDGGFNSIHDSDLVDLSDNEATQIQLARSEWSSGHETEHSIFNAYVNTIASAEHFVYIENQFFITSTSGEQKPVKNLIGAAIVERIIRAFQAGERFKVIVVMPAVPAFAGDLRSDEALGTRAILEFQYYSISRGGHSILETLHDAGIKDPGQYIRFYNLRCFGRINTSRTMKDIENNTGVSYEAAHEVQNEYLGSSIGDDQGEVGTGGEQSLPDQYQSQADQTADQTLDTVSSCYMLDGPMLADIPWDGDADEEMNAYVSEQLYVHSKLLIADDRIVICGSANLNDRSQLGDHDSEIAVVVEDLTPVDSTMNGEAHIASKFAASLRRHIFRKHLSLLPDQKCNQSEVNWLPVDSGDNEYDWGSQEDLLVSDPLHPDFEELWHTTARTNTTVFTKAFHTVPNNCVRTWDDYKNFYSSHFRLPEGGMAKSAGESETAMDVEESEESAGDSGEAEAKYDYGHIVKEEFPGGITEVKQWLGQIKGNLVEMPLDFLADVEDLAKNGLTLNSITDKLYT